MIAILKTGRKTNAKKRLVQPKALANLLALGRFPSPTLVILILHPFFLSQNKPEQMIRDKQMKQ
jgi:hypothetical protein